MSFIAIILSKKRDRGKKKKQTNDQKNFSEKKTAEVVDNSVRIAIYDTLNLLLMPVFLYIYIYIAVHSYHTFYRYNFVTIFIIFSILFLYLFLLCPQLDCKLNILTRK